MRSIQPFIIGFNEKTITLPNSVLSPGPILLNKNDSQTQSATAAGLTKHLKGVEQIAISQHCHISTKNSIMSHSKSHCTQNNPEIPSHISCNWVFLIRMPCRRIKTLGEFTITIIHIFRCTSIPLENLKCGQSVVLRP